MSLEADFFAAQAVPPTIDDAVAAFERRVKGGGGEL